MRKEINKTYSEKLRQLRVSTNKIQDEVAELMNMSQQAYSKIETGQTNFTYKIIILICKVFGIRFEEFIATPPEASTIDTKNKNYESAEENEKYNYKKTKAIEAVLNKKLILEKDLEIKRLEIKCAELELNLNGTLSALEDFNTRHRSNSRQA